MPPLALLLLVAPLLISPILSYTPDDAYSLLSSDENSYSLDDLPDDLLSSNEIELSRRANNNNFMRFGRSGNDYDTADYPEDFARPTRSGKIDKNDHFIRFGRSKQDFLRFGRDQHNDGHHQQLPRRRDNSQSSNFLRFGRNFASRTKRDTAAAMSEKRQSGSSNFMRFGRDRPFLRFGRLNNDNDNNNSLLIQLLNQLLIENLKKQAAVLEATKQQTL